MRNFLQTRGIYIKQAPGLKIALFDKLSATEAWQPNAHGADRM